MGISFASSNRMLRFTSAFSLFLSLGLEARECHEIRELSHLLRLADSGEGITPSPEILGGLQAADVQRHKEWADTADEIAKKDGEGVPRYETRPKSKGYTGYVLAFARRHTGDHELARKLKALADKATKEFWQVNEKYEKEKNLVAREKLAQRQIELGDEVQYYNEMRGPIDGTSFPYFGQPSKDVERFLAMRPDSRASRTETLYRIHFTETKLIETTKTYRTAESSEKADLQKKLGQLLEELKFYRDLLRRFEESIHGIKN